VAFTDFFDDPDEFSYDRERDKFINNMNMLKGMTVEEITLYKKWQELNKDAYKMVKKANKFFNVGYMLWSPTDINNKQQTIKEIEELDPYVEYIKQGDAKDTDTWVSVRKLIHSMEFTPNPGRNLKFFIKDRNTEKVLGVVCLGSDVVAIGVRDKHIGWTKGNKLDDGKLRHTSIATTICCTQPLGFNFLGGKLVAAMTTSSVIRNKWEELYDETLVGITTTALYGIHSMYNGIPHWKTLGESAGRIALKPDDSIYEVWHDWIKENKREEYLKRTTQKEGVAGPKTGVKSIIINMMFKELGIRGSNYDHGFKRGVYYSDIYENGREFLGGNLDEGELIMKKKFIGDVDYINNWWKPKAIRRYIKLFDEGRLKPDRLFYADVVGKTWEQTKEKYLGEIGR
jgi:hypothetical protein